MILKQYYDCLSAMATGNTVAIAAYGGPTYNVSATSAYQLALFYNCMASVAAGSYTSGILLGSGDAAVSFKDYELNSLISGLTGSGAVSKTIDAEGATVSSLLTITNGGDADVTIKEIGLNIKYTGNWAMLMDRTVLDSPITIPAGGVGQITYTIRMNYPTG